MGAANIVTRFVNSPRVRSDMVDAGYVPSNNVEVEEDSPIINAYADADTPEIRVSGRAVAM